jgi:universal stress protein A
VFQHNTELSDALDRQARARMNDLKRGLGYEKIQMEISITSKSARHEILGFAKAHDVDLIVVAPHGQGIIGTLGSTATGILNNAVCDVLAVREAGKLT